MVQTSFWSNLFLHPSVSVFLCEVNIRAVAGGKQTVLPNTGLIQSTQAWTEEKSE